MICMMTNELTFAGPMPMIFGGTPTTEYARNAPRMGRPRDSALDLRITIE